MSSLYETPPWYEGHPIEKGLRDVIYQAFERVAVTSDGDIDPKFIELSDVVFAIDEVAQQRAELDVAPVEVGRPNLHLIPGGDAS